MTRRLLLAFVVLAAASRIDAQTPARCPAVVTTLARGSLTDAVAQSAALRDVPVCLPASAAAYATAIERRRAARLDTRLAAFFRAPIADDVVLRAALRLANDSSASLPARVLALGLLRGYVAGGASASYETLTGATTGEFCVAAPGDGTRTLPSAMPIDSTGVDAIHAAAASLERSGAAPTLRSAANCVMNEWRQLRGLPIQPLLEPSAYRFAVEHACGEDFRLRSYSAHGVEPQLEIEGRTGRRPLDPRPVRTGDSVAVTPFVVQPAGTVRVLFDGQEMARVTPTAAACP